MPKLRPIVITSG